MQGTNSSIRFTFFRFQTLQRHQRPQKKEGVKDKSPLHSIISSTPSPAPANSPEPPCAAVHEAARRRVRFLVCLEKGGSPCGEEEAENRTSMPRQKEGGRRSTHARHVQLYTCQPREGETPLYSSLVLVLGPFGETWKSPCINPPPPPITASCKISGLSGKERRGQGKATRQEVSLP